MQATQGVEGRVGGGSGRRGAAGLDHGRTALLDVRDEGLLEPGVVGDDLGGRLAADEGVGEVRILRRGVVAPDGDVLDDGVVGAGLGGELRLGAVLVEAGHGEEVLGRQVAGGTQRDEGVGVARIADDEDLDGLLGVARDGFALADEDLAVDAEQVLALHAVLARDRADEQAPVGVLEAFVEVAGGDDVGEQRESAVLEFHHDAGEGVEAGSDFDEVKSDRLVGAEDGAGGEAEDGGVADVAGGAGDGDANGGLGGHSCGPI